MTYFIFYNSNLYGIVIYNTIYMWGKNDGKKLPEKNDVRNDYTKRSDTKWPTYSFYIMKKSDIKWPAADVVVLYKRDLVLGCSKLLFGF